MKLINRGLVLAALLAFLTPAIHAADVDKEKAKAPQAVLDTVNKKFPGAKMTDCDKETEEGVEMYKISLTDANGAKHTVMVAPDGKILADKNKATGQTTQGAPAK